MPNGSGSDATQRFAKGSLNTVADAVSKFNKANVGFPNDDTKTRDIKAASDSWPFVEETCKYSSKYLAEYIYEGPKKSGRHHWLLNQLIRTEAYRRFGCWTEADYNKTLKVLEELWESYFKPTSEHYTERAMRDGEYAETHRDAIRLVERKTDAQMARETHHDHNDRQVSTDALNSFVQRLTDKGGTGEQGNGGTGEQKPEVAALSRHVLPAEFWQERDVLTHIWTWAKARLVSPEAVLAAVLQYVSSAVGPQVRIPALPSREGTLNFFLAVVGEASVGKGAATSVARECIDVEGIPVSVGIGTGEGMIKKYKTAIKDSTTKEVTYKRVSATALFDIPEVSTYEALMGRQGQTLKGELLKAYSGEGIGFSNADDMRRIILEDHTYRLGLIMGVQPGRAGVLFADGEVGLPHRFLFVSAYDANAIEEELSPPTALVWVAPEGLSSDDYIEHMAPTYLTYPDSVKQELRIQRLRRLKGEAVNEDMEGHDFYTRTKVAGLFALLDQRIDVNETDWSLSGAVLKYSVGIRSTLMTMGADAKVRAVQYAGDMELVKQTRIEHGKAQVIAHRLAKTVHRHEKSKQHEDGECTRSCLRDAQGRDKKYKLLDEAIEIAEQVGWIKSVSVVGTAQSGYHYKAGSLDP